MAPDGELAFTFGDLGEQQRYSLEFQALPWLETSFRYSHVVGLFSGYDDGHFYDRSFGVKVRLNKESDLLPDLSVGIRDILGTGVLSTEYVVATKNLGPFDVTAGLGWGALAERAAFTNPFGLLLKSFKTRSNSYGTGGLIATGLFFHGPNTGAFGSVAWQSPIEGLQLLAEYSSDKYVGYDFAGGVKVRSPLNLGLSYRPLDSFAVSAGWFYGSTYGITLSVRGDPTKGYPSGVRLGPRVPLPAIRTDAQQQNALGLMQERSARMASVRAGSSWSAVPTPEQYVQQDLLQIFLSETSGVRAIEPEGKSLIVDAKISNSPFDQCARYARVASASHTEFTTLVLADLQNPAGQVYFCSPTTEIANRTPPEGGTKAASATAQLSDKVKNDLGSQDLVFVRLNVGSSEAWLYYENYRYYMAAEAAGRATRVLMADLPANIEVFHLVPSYLGLVLNEITVRRSSLERELSAPLELPLQKAVVQVSDPPLTGPAPSASEGFHWPILYTALDPKLTQRMFDPDHPVEFMVYGDATALLEITPQITLSTELTGTIWSNYTFTRDAGSALHHVRTDLLQYQRRGKYGISGLQLIYHTRLAPDVFAEVRGGYLEDMFMGFGGQVVWRPAQSRLTFGADLYEVWQRSYNRLFGLQRFDGKHYEVLTGHVSAYYASPWYGLNFAVHMGRYLAGDHGATFEISRRFASGIEVGAWATFTNVPFSRFGEGSFDKGIMLHIPFEWGLPIWTQSSYDLQMHSLTRDGGQRLAGDDSLYGETDALSDREIMDHIDAFREP